MKEDRQDLTTGSIWGKMLFFSIPLVLTNFLQVLFNMADIAYFEQTLKIKNDLIDKSNATQAMKDAQKAANEYETYNSVYDTRKSANDGYMGTYFDLYGQKDKYDAYKGVDDKRIAQNDAVQKALDAGIIQHEEYYQTLKDIDAQYVASKQAILVGGYQSIFGSMTSLMSAFGFLSRLCGGEDSKSRRLSFSLGTNKLVSTLRLVTRADV